MHRIVNYSGHGVCERGTMGIDVGVGSGGEQANVVL